MNSLLDALRQVPLLAILRGLPPERAVSVGQELVAAGFTALEVPLNGAAALEALEALVGAVGDRAVVGAGTVLEAEQVEAISRVGARFAVMPNTNPRVLQRCRSARLPSIPGVATPSEAFAALREGALALKLFPAQAIPPSVVRAWRSVLPREAHLVAVGGIQLAELQDYRSAGVSSFGIGSSLYHPRFTSREVGEAGRRWIQAISPQPA